MKFIVLVTPLEKKSFLIITYSSSMIKKNTKTFSWHLNFTQQTILSKTNYTVSCSYMEYKQLQLNHKDFVSHIMPFKTNFLSIEHILSIIEQKAFPKMILTITV